ncbi:IclR family transcriptional regulator [Paraburkholderia strydomiana]|jgi:DNA-binding IclR family transcriptional regulator|uniref:IclR family transcriptional regulator n=1 Tax=Paraburkholderia strydomiana TaxID=1245417 RepID=UPI0038BAF8FB
MDGFQRAAMIKNQDDALYVEPVSNRENQEEARGSSLERMLSLLDLFTEQKPLWSADGLAAERGFTRSATYRYLRELADSGLIAPVETGRYSLGPRIIQLGRQLAESDPMLVTMKDIEAHLPQLAAKQKWHLCRLFRDQVIAIGEYGHLDADLSYRRGCPMPLLRGATSTAVLAWLPERQLMRIYLENQEHINTATLGSSWRECRKALGAIRQRGYAVAQAEVDPDVFALAAPIFNAEGRVTGSISVVRHASEYDAARIPAEGEIVAALGQRMTEGIKRIAAG